MIDVVTVGAGGGSIAWISPEGTLKVGPAVGRRRPRPALLRQGRHRADHHRRPRRARPDPPAPARRRDPARRRRRARRASTRSPRALGLDLERCATGILEISAWNQANALRQVTRQARPRRPRLHAGDLRRLGLAARLPARRHPRPRRRASCPQNPGNVSAFGLLTVDVKNDYVQTAVARHARPRPRRRAEDLRRPHRPGRDGPRRARASPRDGAPLHAHRRPALLRPGLRGPRRRTRRRRSTRRMPPSVADALPRRAPRALRLRLPRRPDASRSSGSTSASPASARSPARAARARRRDGAADVARAGPTARPPGVLRRRRRLRRHRRLWRPTCCAGDTVEGPAVIEEFGSTVPVHPGFVVRVDALGNLVITKSRTARRSLQCPATRPSGRRRLAATRRHDGAVNPRAPTATSTATG